MTCESSGVSGGARVFVDQAAQDGFSVDPLPVEVGNGEAAIVVFAVRDALGDALVRPGRVVMRLVVGQYGAQMRLTENQHAVKELSAQGADEAFAGRVHARRLDSGAHDFGPGGLEDGVEGWREVRSAVAEQELNVLEPLAEAECDLGVMMRNDPIELLGGDPWARAHWLAERCGLDATAIWEWGVVERVTSGLRCTRINLQPLGLAHA